MLDNAVFFAGSILAGFFTYAFQFISGRLLGPSAYSVVAAVFSVIYLLTVPNLVVTTVAARYAASLTASGDVAGLRSLFRRMSLALGACGLIAGVVYGLATPVIATLLHIPLLALLLLAPAIPVFLLVQTGRGILQGQNRFIALSAVLLADAIGRAFLCLVLVKAGFGALGALAAVTIATTFGYGVALLALRHLLTGTAAHFSMTDPLKFSLPATVAVMGIVLLSNLDILFVKHFFAGPRQGDAGIYASVATLGKIVYYATFSISTVMFPRIVAHRARGDASRTTLAVSALGVLLVAGGAIGIMGLFPGLALLPFGNSYAPAAAYLPVFAGAMGLLSFANLLTSYLLAVSDHRFIGVLALAVIAEVVLISLNHESLWDVIHAVLTVLVTASAALALLVATHLVRHEPAQAVLAQ